MKIRIGTRGSTLARWQTDFVADLLRQAHNDVTIEVVVITTRGDTEQDKALPVIGGKGVFTEELERALLDGEIDCAIHSLKDLPTSNTGGLTIGAVPERGPVEDVLISREGDTLDTLPQGAQIGTSSQRRAAQLIHWREDLTPIDIRGNVPTRIDKAIAADGPYDAIVLALAGVDRLGLRSNISEILPLEVMLNAPGQGALAVQCRDDTESLALFAPLEHLPSRLTVTAEREFLRTLEGGCSVPVAAHAHIEQNMLRLHGRVTALDGKNQIDVKGDLLGDEFSVTDAASLGRRLAQQALDQGADKLLAEIRP